MSKEINNTPIESEEKGTLANPYSLFEAIREDFFGNGIARQIADDLLNRNENVAATAKLALAPSGALAMAWSTTDDVY